VAASAWSVALVLGVLAAVLLLEGSYATWVVLAAVTIGLGVAGRTVSRRREAEGD
jgi:hypothetical protein